MKVDNIHCYGTPNECDNIVAIWYPVGSQHAEESVFCEGRDTWKETIAFVRGSLPRNAEVVELMYV